MTEEARLRRIQGFAEMLEANEPDSSLCARLRRIIGLAAKLETNDAQVSEMMRLRIADGLAAMAYGQYGGSFPDPTPRSAFDANGDPRDPVKWRDHKPELDIVDYSNHILKASTMLSIAVRWTQERAQCVAKAETALAAADNIRRRHMSANNDLRNRLDPSDWCALHFAMHIYEGHRRVKGPLCKICAGFYDVQKREPTATEADYYHRHGRWPHKLVDPKERRAV